jgi:hypothetical protein
MLDAYRDLIDELLGTPSAIRTHLGQDGAAGLSPQAKQLAAELRDRDRAVLARLQAITREESPYLSAFRPGPPLSVDDPSMLLDEMELARGDLVSLLMNLALKDWERPAIDETEGEITLVDEVERHVEFDEAHRRQFLALQPER